MSTPELLIARKVAAEPPEMTAVLLRLQERFGLDSYTARQRLLGRGLALLAQGPAARLDALAEALTPLGLQLVRLAPSPVAFEPQRLTALRVGAEDIRFTCGSQELSLQRGEAVIAILADLSGALIDKSLKQLMVHNAYRGAAAVTPIGDEEVYRTILRAQPVLDLYLLNESGRPRGAVRVFPGRYDPKGLGARMSYSGPANLEALLALVRERAGRFTLHTGFGLDLLPGCTLKTGEEESPFSRDNLAGLTRYGRLMLDLAAATPSEWADAPTPAGPAAAAGVPELMETAGELTADRPQTQAPPSAPDLPPPPEVNPDHPGVRRRLLGLGSAAFGAVIYLALEGPGLLVQLARLGLGSGLLPALGAALCGWGGFHFLRLKRTMENTPTSRIRSVAMGMVELRGRAVRRYALVSPMTHLACVYWRLETFRRDGNDQWQSVGSRSSGPLPFDLEDATGRITVDPRGAGIRCRQRQEGHPGQVSMLLTGGGSGDPQEKWVEEVLAEGASLYVLGYAAPVAEGGPSLRERTLERLRRLKGDPRALAHYDRDGNGRICTAEWDAARRTEEEQALHDSLREPAGAVRTRIGRPPHRGLPFLIAESASEAHLTRKYGWYAGPLLLAALGFASWALAIWSPYLFPA